MRNKFGKFYICLLVALSISATACTSIAGRDGGILHISKQG